MAGPAAPRHAVALLACLALACPSPGPSSCPQGAVSVDRATATADGADAVVATWSGGAAVGAGLFVLDGGETFPAVYGEGGWRASITTRHAGTRRLGALDGTSRPAPDVLGCWLSAFARCSFPSCQPHSANVVELAFQPGPAAALCLPDPPAGVLGRTPWPPLTVRVCDANGNPGPTASGSVTLRVARGTGRLAGTLVRELAGGAAAFDDLVYDAVETVELAFATPGLAEGRASVDVGSGPAASVAIARGPGAHQVHGIPLGVMSVEVQDAAGNRVVSDPARLVAVDVKPPGAVRGVAGSVQVTAVAGRAALEGLVPLASGTLWLAAAAAGLASGAPLAVEVGAPLVSGMPWVRLPAQQAALAGDGRFVAMVSDVGGGRCDLRVLDRATGVIEAVGDAARKYAAGPCQPPVISAQGRYAGVEGVVFDRETGASVTIESDQGLQLSAGGGVGLGQRNYAIGRPYLLDLVSGAPIALGDGYPWALAADGIHSVGEGYGWLLAGDGRHLAFTSCDPAVVWPCQVTGGAVLDLASGKLTTVPGQITASGGDGSLVLLGLSLLDLATGMSRSVDPGAAPPGSSQTGGINLSGDGRYVTFTLHVAGSGERARVSDLASAASFFGPLPDTSSPVAWASAVSWDGRYLLALSNDPALGATSASDWAPVVLPNPLAP